MFEISWVYFDFSALVYPNYEMGKMSLILLIEHCHPNETTISQKTCRKLAINSFPNHRSNVERKLIFKAFPIKSSRTAKWKIKKKIENQKSSNLFPSIKLSHLQFSRELSNWIFHLFVCRFGVNTIQTIAVISKLMNSK